MTAPTANVPEHGGQVQADAIDVEDPDISIQPTIPPPLWIQRIVPPAGSQSPSQPSRHRGSPGRHRAPMPVGSSPLPSRTAAASSSQVPGRGVVRGVVEAEDDGAGVLACQITGFTNPELNSVYSISSRVLVGGREIYWSQNRRHFMYFQAAKGMWHICPRFEPPSEQNTVWVDLLRSSSRWFTSYGTSGAEQVLARIR